MVTDRIIGCATIMVVVLLLAGTLAVLRLHARALRARGRGERGLLSWHVAAISTSYLSLAALVAIGLLDRVTPLDVDAVFPFTYRLIGYFVACLLGLVALVIVGRAQVRVHSLCPSPRRTVTEERSTVIEGEER